MTRKTGFDDLLYHKIEKMGAVIWMIMTARPEWYNTAIGQAESLTKGGDGNDSQTGGGNGKADSTSVGQMLASGCPAALVAVVASALVVATGVCTGMCLLGVACLRLNFEQHHLVVVDSCPT